MSTEAKTKPALFNRAKATIPDFDSLPSGGSRRPAPTSVKPEEDTNAQTTNGLVDQDRDVQTETAKPAEQARKPRRAAKAVRKTVARKSEDIAEEDMKDHRVAALLTQRQKMYLDINAKLAGRNVSDILRELLEASDWLDQPDLSKLM